VTKTFRLQLLQTMQVRLKQIKYLYNGNHISGYISEKCFSCMSSQPMARPPNSVNDFIFPFFYIKMAVFWVVAPLQG
jgi:hypothetical protein